mmetsp:Transcript_6234/g.15136  ORF Transcript_6234/g.15136 Transcript_6234/m.15136 type:complete len:205 (-) Transcript_6234:382-996(-)
MSRLKNDKSPRLAHVRSWGLSVHSPLKLAGSGQSNRLRSASTRLSTRRQNDSGSTGGTAPLRRLTCTKKRLKEAAARHVDTADGMVPESAFANAEKNFIAAGGHSAISLGMVPVRPLSLTLKKFMRRHAPTSVGIVPVSMLSYTENTSSSVRVPTSVGMLPRSWFEPTARSTSSVSNCKSDGSVPLRLADSSLMCVTASPVALQ